MKRVPLPPVMFYLSLGVMIGAAQIPAVAYPSPMAFRLGGLLLLVLGVLLAVWGSATFKRMKTNIKTFDKPDALVMEGPFRFSRNPMYVGMIVALAGASAATSTYLGWGVVMAFALLVAFVYVPFEERLMLSAFGESYISYSKRVRRWI